MKKLLALALAASMTVSLASCGKTGGDSGSTGSTGSAVTAVTASDGNVINFSAGTCRGRTSFSQTCNTAQNGGQVYLMLPDGCGLAA